VPRTQRIRRVSYPAAPGWRGRQRAAPTARRPDRGRAADDFSHAGCSLPARNKRSMANKTLPTEHVSPIDGTSFSLPPRIAYERAPLVGVVAQLRYPALLIFEKELPGNFQEAIRGIFPLLEPGAPLIAAGQQLLAAIIQLLQTTAGSRTLRNTPMTLKTAQPTFHEGAS
jgi:hypothetical protein